jgi:hypothetical protein
MTIRDIVKKFTAEELSYVDAIQELKKISLDYDDEEDITLVLQRIRDLIRQDGKNADTPLIHNFYDDMSLSFVMNEQHDEIIYAAAEMIQKGSYPQIVINELIDSYNLSGPLAAYFFHEAESRVRLKTLNDEEFEALGRQWSIMRERAMAEALVNHADKMRIMSMIPVIKKLDEADDEEDEEDE